LRGPDAAAAFAAWRGHFPLAVTTIVPDAKHTPTRHLESPEEVAAFVREISGKANIYYTHGTLLDLVNKKPKKEHFTGTDFVHADLDPPKDALSPEQIDQWVSETVNGLEAACRKSNIPPPSAVICSGNGLNLLWRLDEFFAFGNPADPEQRRQRIREIESRTRGICVALKADRGTHNIDRILRLPGGDNLPTKTKREIGRVRRESSIVYLSDARYPVEAFPQVWEDEKPNPGVGSDAPGRIAIERGDVIRLRELEELDQWNVPDRVKAIIVNGRNPHEPPKKGDDSRSAWMFDAICEMVRRGVPPGLIVGILTDEDLGISRHVRDQPRHVDYAWEQVKNATAKVAQDGADFARDKDGKPYPNHQGNIRLALRKLDVRVCFDRFAERTLIDGLDGFGPHLGEAAMTRLWLTISERFGVKAGKEFFWSVVEDAARRDSFHPVVDYLDGLKWDGVKRIDDWLATYMGAESDEYTRHVGALWLIAAVRRVRQPGCKFDEMVIFESEQGKDKSTALAILAVREEWFSDDLPLGADAKVVIERTQGRWIVEAAELDGMGKKDVESLKAMLSRRIDRSRMAWGRMTHEAPRQFVVIGTTNGQQYLRDSTGNRRFWPVRVGNVDVEALRRDRDQLWAEAAKREAEGASIRLDKDLWKSAAAEQSKRRLLDPYFVALHEALGDRTGKIRTRDVWRIVGVSVDRRTPQHEQRVGEAMRELGFERKQGRFGGGGPEYAYVRGTKAERLRQIEVAGDERTGWTVIEEEPARPAQTRLEQAGGDDEPY
jgi:hypothetical protein